MATNHHDLTIYKPFRSEGGTDQVSQPPDEELDLEVNETAFSESQQTLVVNDEGPLPTVLVTKERIKQNGRGLEVSQKLTSDSESETDFEASISPKGMLPRNFSSSTCTTHSAQSQHVFSEFEYSSDSSAGEGLGTGQKRRYLLSIQKKKKRCSMHKDPKGGKLQAHRTALPPEYQFSIRPHMFASQWSKTKGFKGGGLKLKTTTALSPNNTSEASGDCETNATVTITVKNAKLECQYKAVVKVALYDPNTGNILSEKKEEGNFTGVCGHVEFTVSLGSQRDIVSCRSRRLKLQVKVEVHQERTVS